MFVWSFWRCGGLSILCFVEGATFILTGSRTLDPLLLRGLLRTLQSRKKIQASIFLAVRFEPRTAWWNM